MPGRLIRKAKKKVYRVPRLARPDEFYISRGIPHNNFHAVDGKTVSVPNADYLDLFIVVEKSSRGYERKWTISEGITGKRIGVGLTKKAAIARAESNLSKHSQEEVCKQIRSVVEDIGVSPRYGRLPKVSKVLRSPVRRIR